MDEFKLLSQQQQKNVVRLLIEHRSSIFAYLLAMTRDHDVSEEIIQEVSIVVIENAENFELGTSFQAWVREIARRRILSYWKSRKIRPVHLTDEFIDQLDAGFRQIDGESKSMDRGKALEHCLQQLQPFLRLLVDLRFSQKNSRSNFKRS
jgi:RNA polymerase sigma factor (sigma-70 family)